MTLHPRIMTVLLLVAVFRIATPLTVCAQHSEGGTGLLLTREAEVLGRGRFAVGGGSKFLRREGGMHSLPLFLYGGLGARLEFSLMLPLATHESFAPRMMGDYASAGIFWRTYGEERSPFRLGLYGSVQQELLYSRNVSSGGSLFLAGPVCTFRPAGSLQFNLNLLYAESSSDATPSHWIFSAGSSRHLTERIELILDGQYASEGYSGSGNELQVLAGARYNALEKMSFTLAAGIGSQGGESSPLLMVTVALFSEPPMHTDYRGFVSRIRPLPLAKVDELLNESLTSRDPIAPPQASPDRLAPIVEFAPNSAVLSDTTSLRALSKQLRADSSGSGYLLLGAAEDSTGESSFLALTRAVTVMEALLQKVPHAQLVAGVSSTSYPNTIPPGCVVMQAWPVLQRDLSATVRRGRAVSVGSAEAPRLASGMSRVGAPKQDEVVVLSALGGDTGERASALGLLLLAADELCSQELLPMEQLVIGVNPLVGARELEEEPKASWSLLDWAETSDSLFATLRLEESGELRPGARMVGLLKTQHGWMSSTGELLPSLQEMKFRRSTMNLPESGRTVRIGWRLGGEAVEQPVVRVAVEAAQGRELLIPVNLPRRAEAMQLIEKAGFDSPRLQLPCQLRVIAAPGSGQ